MKKKEKDNRKLASKVKNSAAGNGHQTGSASRGGEFDPRGVRKMDAQARPLGSLPAGIKKTAAVAAAAVIVMTAAAGLTGIIRQKSAERKYMDSLLEQGYLWETESTEKYIVVHVGFPETVSETPTVTVTSQKDEEQVLEGTVTVSENSLSYTAVITEGDWKVTSSCSGCVTVVNNLRVEEDDELIYMGQTLPLQEEQENGVLDGFVDGIRGLFE